MPSNKRLAGGVSAMLLVGAAGFVGLYLMIQRTSIRVSEAKQTAAQTAPAPAEADTVAASEAPEVVAVATPSAQVAESPAPVEANAAAPKPSAETGGESQAAASSADALASDQVDLSLDEPSLVKFLTVKKKIWAVYEPHRRDFAVLNEDLGEIQTQSKKAMARATTFVPMQQARRAGLAETGLSEDEYKRIARVVYDNWWRATAGNVNIDEKVAEARSMLARTEKKLAEPGQAHQRIHHLSARRNLAMTEVGRLEWARSHPAKELLEEIPASTRTVCDKHAFEIDALAMKEGDLLLY